jgi:hypothetical protein
LHKFVHSLAYQRFWQKSFVLDLRNVVLLDRYMECVPTACIRSYILVFDSSQDFPPAEMVLSRSGGKWQASERTEYVPQRGNIGSRIPIKMVLKKAHKELRWFNTHMLYAKPAKWCKMSEKTPTKKRANKKFSRKDNKLKTKAKRVPNKAFKAWKNRPESSIDVQGAPRSTGPMSGPLTMGALLSMLKPIMCPNLGFQLPHFEVITSEAEWCQPYSNDQLSRWMSHDVYL